MMSVGMGTFEVNLKRDDIRTVDDVLAAIKAKVDEVGPGNWVFGRGYDHFQLDVKRHPQREELDLVAPENPVSIKRTCGNRPEARRVGQECVGTCRSGGSP